MNSGKQGGASPLCHDGARWRRGRDCLRAGFGACGLGAPGEPMASPCRQLGAAGRCVSDGQARPAASLARRPGTHAASYPRGGQNLGALGVETVRSVLFLRAQVSRGEGGLHLWPALQQDRRWSPIFLRGGFGREGVPRQERQQAGDNRGQARLHRGSAREWDRGQGREQTGDMETEFRVLSSLLTSPRPRAERPSPGALSRPWAEIRR